LTNRLVLAAATVFAILISAALVAPQLTPIPPDEQTLSARLTPPVWTNRGLASHLLGTDQLGRDVFSNIVYGLRISLMAGILSVMLSMLIGLTLGLIAGYAGRMWDSMIMRAVDVQLSLPYIMIALCAVVMFGQGLWKLILVMAVSGWAFFTRLVRAQVLSIREKEYVEAARALGLPPAAIMIRYLLPNAITSIIVLCALEVPRMILLESTLSFLGLGVPAETPTLGLAIARGYQVLFAGNYWVSIFPGVVLMLLVGCINIMTDWLRDVLDPRARIEV
jgi:peptide/nickel transport system permease protein